MTLAEAQAELANDYGFRTWADLRAEVDRLRTRTLVADATVASQIADEFDLGTVTGEMVAANGSGPASGGPSPRTEGSGRRRRCSGTHRWSRGCFEDEMRLVEAACSAGITAPVPVRTRDGSVLATIEHRRLARSRRDQAGAGADHDYVRSGRDSRPFARRPPHRALPTDRSLTAPPSAPIRQSCCVLSSTAIAAPRIPCRSSTWRCSRPPSQQPSTGPERASTSP